MIFTLLIVLLTLFSTPAQAQDQTGCVDLTWTAPTQNTDGSELTDLAGFKIYYGTVSGTYDQSVTIDSPTADNYSVCQLSTGTWYFVATAYNTSGIESDYSNEATKTVLDTLVAPNEPLITLTSSIAYQLIKVDNGLIWNAVGTVPGGTECIATEAAMASGVTRYAVPRTAVVLSGNIQLPLVVFADCE